MIMVFSGQPQDPTTQELLPAITQIEYVRSSFAETFLSQTVRTTYFPDGTSTVQITNGYVVSGVGQVLPMGSTYGLSVLANDGVRSFDAFPSASFTTVGPTTAPQTSVSGNPLTQVQVTTTILPGETRKIASQTGP
jgi:hypothetical protein